MRKARPPETPPDRTDAPQTVRWRGYVLKRQARRHHGRFLRWANTVSWEVAPLWLTIEVDGDSAWASLSDEEHTVVEFKGTGDTEDAALERVASALKKWFYDSADKLYGLESR